MLLNIDWQNRTYVQDAQDYIEIFIDNVLQSFIANSAGTSQDTTNVFSYHGSKAQFSFEVPAGAHTIKLKFNSNHLYHFANNTSVCLELREQP